MGVPPEYLATIFFYCPNNKKPNGTIKGKRFYFIKANASPLVIFEDGTVIAKSDPKFKNHPGKRMCELYLCTTPKLRLERKLLLSSYGSGFNEQTESLPFSTPGVKDLLAIWESKATYEKGLEAEEYIPKPNERPPSPVPIVTVSLTCR